YGGTVLAAPDAHAGPGVQLVGDVVYDCIGARHRPILPLYAGNLQPMATTDEHRTIAPIVGPDDPRRFTDSGIEIKPLYNEGDLPDQLSQRLGELGEYLYTRGVHTEMYRKQLWMMRQYAGYASAKESNERYRYLLEHGS